MLSYFQYIFQALFGGRYCHVRKSYNWSSINPNPKLFKFVTLQYTLHINHLDLLTDAVIVK